jgi:hypothetical protein
MSHCSIPSLGLGVLGVLGTAGAVFVPIACGGRSAPTISASVADASTGGDARYGGYPTDDAATATGTTGDDGGDGSSPDGMMPAQGPGTPPMPETTPTGSVRLADWAPDAPGTGFDVCVVPHGTDAAWTGPLLGGPGVAFPNVGRYVAIAPGTYDLKVVPAGGACGTAVAPTIQLAPLIVNAKTTVAIVGDLSPGGNDQAAKVVSFADDNQLPTGIAAVRFIDAMPGASAVIFGLGKTTDLTFAALTPNVPFGTVSATLPDGGVADSNSYMLLDPLSGGTLSAHLPSGDYAVSSSTNTSFINGMLTSPNMPSVLGAGTDVATGTNATWPVNSLITVALVKGSGGPNGQFVLCHDDAAAEGTLSACNVLSP